MKDEMNGRWLALWMLVEVGWDHQALCWYIFTNGKVRTCHVLDDHRIFVNLSHASILGILGGFSSAHLSCPLRSIVTNSFFPTAKLCYGVFGPD